MSKASEQALGELHGEVARTLTAAVQVLDTENGKVFPSAAYIAVAVGFLKNNAITADAGKNEALSELQEQLRKKRTEAKGKLVSRESIDKAAAILEAGLAPLMDGQ